MPIFDTLIKTKEVGMKKKVTICGIDTSTLPKLTKKESDELMKKVKQGDKIARRRYIMCNMRLVLSVVQRYSARVKTMDDIFQADRKSVV